MLRRFKNIDLSQLLVQRLPQLTGLRSFSTAEGANNESQYLRNSRANFVKQQRAKINIDKLLGASNRRTFYKSTLTEKPLLYSMYMIDQYSTGLRVEPDGRFDIQNVEQSILNRGAELIETTARDVDRATAYLSAWCEKTFQKEAGVELPPEKQKRVEELLKKLRTLDTKKFNTDGIKLISQIKEIME